MQKTLAVIPARLGSTRFPRKVLYPWKGEPLLFHVWERIGRAKTVDQVVVATDSPEIEQAARGFGADVVRTSKRCRTGSDRTAEVLQKIGGDIVINIQADSLNLSPSALDMVVKAMKKDRSVRFATLARRIRSDDELFDPNRVKVVTTADDQALWFSRFPIPYIQQTDVRSRWRQFRFLLHIGIYFFRAEALRQYAAWPRTPLEKAESLEQLRILEQGETLRVFTTNMKSLTIDTPEDLNRLAGIARR
jgi:3-deoxy-manno-octulosonate cytidylyltransferase (CMP-KDO synthetase)